MKVIVTGGAGFIGSALIRFFLKNTNYDVLNIDKLTYAANLKNLENAENNNCYNFLKKDICDKGIYEVFLKFEPDVLMHLAAESHVDNSINDPKSFIDTNILGTYNLLEASRKYLSLNKKEKFLFHHVSTDEVFGDLPHPDFDKQGSNKLFNENSRYEPSSPYSASKASSDHLVKAWSKTFDVPVIITNCSNNYGPYHHPEKLIPKTIINAINAVDIPVYGNGSQIRDWLYVEDHIEALFKVIHNGKNGETYNIGGNQERRNIEVVRIICDIVEELYPAKKNKKMISKKVINYSDLIKFVPDRLGHDLRYAVDNKKIKKELKWKPKEDFNTGLKKTIKWYIDNIDWVKNTHKI